MASHKASAAADPFDLLHEEAPAPGKNAAVDDLLDDVPLSSPASRPPHPLGSAAASNGIKTSSFSPPLPASSKGAVLGDTDFSSVSLDDPLQAAAAKAAGPPPAAAAPPPAAAPAEGRPSVLKVVARHIKRLSNVPSEASELAADGMEMSHTRNSSLADFPDLSAAVAASAGRVTVDALPSHSATAPTEPPLTANNGSAPSTPPSDSGTGPFATGGSPAGSSGGGSGTGGGGAGGYMGHSMVEELLMPAIAANAVMKVYVKDPERVETSKLGIKSSYYTYGVHAECSLPGFFGTATSVSVRRRFSDFDALHKLLKAHFRGYFIPPLPEKSFVDSRFARDGFLRVRRVDLQAYMRSVANHPVLRVSDEVRMFLTTPGDLGASYAWQSCMHRAAKLEPLRPSTAVPEASSSGGNLQSVAPTFLTRMRHTIGGVTEGVFARKKQDFSEEEQQLRQARDWFRELQGHLQAACTSARTLVQHMEQLCEDWADLGKSFSVMARYEEGVVAKAGQYTESGQAAVRRAGDLTKMGYANVKQHNLHKQFAMRTAASLVFLHDYCILVPEAIVALEDREAALSVVEMLQQELATRKQTAARAEEAAARAAAQPAAQRRLQQAQDALAAVQEQLRAGRELYSTLKERNKSELQRLNLERATDFREALANFAGVQAQLAMATSEIWTAVAKQYTNQDATEEP